MSEMSLCGSSPRARGTPEHLDDKVEMSRFIPACAGNARRMPESLGMATVHPRVRGERTIAGTLGTIRDGSSPRARGTPHRLLDHSLRHRFIPACAGNARARSTRSIRATVHPRVRGERVLSHLGDGLPGGSSPRARGTRVPCGRRGRLSRFIPACAGNANRCSLRRSRVTVHPRVRGERASRFRLTVQPAGSSPRARGTLQRSSAQLRGGQRAANGSSPRARGTREYILVCVDGDRFIPACAGNARTPPCDAAIRAVHPRVRGERPSLS